VAKRLEKAAFAAIAQGYQLKIYDAYRPREATIALYDQAIGLKDQPIPLETYTGKVLEDLPVLEEGQILTYGNLMTDFNRYAMNYFLAAGKSRHNRGIALDLTLANLDTGRDLPMQTSMHDLSWYSENARDNGNARKLSAIMESVGFTGLRSEWWHFNDLEVQDTFQPEYMMKGVTPECWMKDDRGWRYRKSNGDYYTDCVKKINDTEYTFDENGYVIP
jgi:D-alanyl-D-alanine dipeptidase